MSLYNRTNKQIAVFLSFLFPFVGLCYTLIHWRESWAKNVFWIICVYLGAVFVYCPEGTILGIGSDGGRYVLWLQEMYDSGIGFRGILDLYLVDAHTMDLYFPIVCYVVSRFTDNGHVLFTVFAVVFGFFYSRNIWYVLEKISNKRLGFLIILVFLFFLTNPITHINGARYNTAIHIYVYALLPFLIDNDRSKLWWLVTVPFVHFSFLYVVVMATIYVLLPRRILVGNRLFLFLAVAVFIGSLFVNSLNLTSVSEVLEAYSPESFEERIDMYVSQDVADKRAEAMAVTNWYVGASGIIKYWIYSLLLLLILPSVMRNSMSETNYSNLYSFTLIFGAFANIMALIPSGGRFLLVSHMFMISIILLVVTNVSQNDRIREIIKIPLVVLIIPLIVGIRSLFDFFSITAVFGNFITVLLWENNVPLIRYVKML